jgi:hypothetical protein
MTREQLLETIAMRTPLDEVVGPNVDLFCERYKTAKGLNFFWGESAHEMTPDERAAYILQVDDSIAKNDARPERDRMYDEMLKSYSAMNQAIKNCQFDVDRICNNPYTAEELENRLHNIFGIIESAQMTLGNWITREDMHTVHIT